MAYSADSFTAGEVPTTAKWNKLWSNDADFDSRITQSTPVGAIRAYGGTSAPAGNLLCDGSAVSRTTYAALFAIVGTAFGAGDGSTTFNLPNLKGRVPVGRDAAQTEFDVLGEVGGHKLMQSHDHESATNGFWLTSTFEGGVDKPIAYGKSSGTTAGFRTGYTGGGNAQNLQPYQVVNYIIKT